MWIVALINQNVPSQTQTKSMHYTIMMRPLKTKYVVEMKAFIFKKRIVTEMLHDKSKSVTGRN